MNAKKVKKLRQLVRSMKEFSNKEQPAVKYVENENRRKFGPEYEVHMKDEEGVPKVDEEGKPVVETRRQMIASGTLTLDPKCERGFYKKLKQVMGTK